jgi:hypothetical protein
MDRETAVKGLKLATTYFDFIDVDLYGHEDRYTVKEMEYWLWSEVNQELQGYKMVEYFQTWDMLKEWVEGGILYIK